MFNVSYKPESVWTKVESLNLEVHARVWLGNDRADRVPIVLVPGLGRSSRYMIPLGRRLASRGYDVLAPDLPGFGRTLRPPGASWPAGPDVREQADQLLAWLDSRGIQRAVLFGDSVGAQVSVDLAVRFPDRVDRLILEGPGPDPKYRSPLRQYSRVLVNLPYEAPTLPDVMQVENASTGVPRMVQQLRRTVDDPIESKLPNVQAPTLVLRGRHDKTITQAWAEEVTRLLPDGRLVVIEGAAHHVHYTASEVVTRVMSGFLEGGYDAQNTADEDGVSDDVVVPRLTPQDDPLGPPQPISTKAHGVIDYTTSAVCMTLPRIMNLGLRTRMLLAMVGVSTKAYSMLTDYELGARRKLPMTVHLNIDACTGIGLLVASATLLRGEKPAGRWVTAAVGAYSIFAALATQKPMGPAKLVRVTARTNHAQERRQPVEVAETSAAQLR